MSLALRRLAAAEAPEAARYLDSCTQTLRWLVAFFRHFHRLPPDEEENWSLWRGDSPPGSGSELRCIAAHFYPDAVSYVAAGEGVDFESIEPLLDEELLPERLVGDERVVGAWRASSPTLQRRARGWREIDVLRSHVDGDPELPPGFRTAARGDLPVLEEYGRLLGVELGEDVVRDFAALVEHQLVAVVERGARVQGFVRSNFSDGRFVHGGGLYVHPLYRGQGVGRALAAGLAIWTRRSQGADAVLDVYADSLAARRAYTAAGYEPLGRGLEARFDEDAWRGS